MSGKGSAGGGSGKASADVLLGRQIPYNSEDLSNYAFQVRVGTGVSDLRNVAVALLKSGKKVYGVSKGKGFHSEDDILAKLERDNIDPSEVVALYSDRQPCQVCAPKLTSALNSKVDITWAVPWGSNPSANRVSDDMLSEMISQHRRR